MGKAPRENAIAEEPARSSSLAALEEMLEVQRKMLELGAELSLLVSQLRASPEKRAATHQRLDELMATLAALAEQVQLLDERYRNGG
jgi:uncharacterized coiled-coil DUF342 family protein